jgi:hypothetical protein
MLSRYVGMYDVVDSRNRTTVDFSTADDDRPTAEFH